MIIIAIMVTLLIFFVLGIILDVVIVVAAVEIPSRRLPSFSYP